MKFEIILFKKNSNWKFNRLKIDSNYLSKYKNVFFWLPVQVFVNQKKIICFFTISRSVLPQSLCYVQEINDLIVKPHNSRFFQILWEFSNYVTLNTQVFIYVLIKCFETFFFQLFPFLGGRGCQNGKIMHFTICNCFVLL